MRHFVEAASTPSFCPTRRTSIDALGQRSEAGVLLDAFKANLGVRWPLRGRVDPRMPRHSHNFDKRYAHSKRRRPMSLFENSPFCTAVNARHRRDAPVTGVRTFPAAGPLRVNGLGSQASRSETGRGERKSLRLVRRGASEPLGGGSGWGARRDAGPGASGASRSGRSSRFHVLDQVGEDRGREGHSAKPPSAP